MTIISQQLKVVDKALSVFVHTHLLHKTLPELVIDSGLIR